MINNENVQKFKSWDLVLTPVIKSKNPNEDKKPKTKNGAWYKDWTDQELLDANRIGAYHRIVKSLTSILMIRNTTPISL